MSALYGYFSTFQSIYVDGIDISTEICRLHGLFRTYRVRYVDAVDISIQWFWLASRPRLGGLWSQAGGSAVHQCAGCREEPPRQELVFIGQSLPQTEMTEALHAALLTPEEFALGESGWGTLDDPFPE